MSGRFDSMKVKEFLTHLLLDLIYTAVICVIIAVLFLVIANSDFIDSLVISQSTGFLACCTTMISLYILKPNNGN